MNRYDTAIRIAEDTRIAAEKREADALEKIKLKLSDPTVSEEEKARLRARIRNICSKIKNGAATPTPCVSQKPSPKEGTNAQA